MKTKKELKEVYHQRKLNMGVFQIRNLQSNKILLDSNIDVNAAWNRHRFQLNNHSHPNKLLQEDWNNLGESEFNFEIVSEFLEDKSHEIDYRKEVKKLEEMFLEDLQPFMDKGYNHK